MIPTHHLILHIGEGWWRWETVSSLKLTFSHLQMDGWKTIVSFWDGATWQVRTVSIREGTVIMLKEATFSGEMMVPWWLFLPNASNVGFFGTMEMTCNITEITQHSTLTTPVTPDHPEWSFDVEVTVVSVWWKFIEGSLRPQRKHHSSCIKSD